jgi:hypothetical protein
MFKALYKHLLYYTTATERFVGNRYAAVFLAVVLYLRRMPSFWYVCVSNELG